MPRGRTVIEPFVRKAAEERIADLEAEDLARQRSAAEVLLARRVHALHRIDEHSEIDLVQITCAEYQIYLDEQREAGKKRLPPEHWAKPRFTAGQARDPICGVRPDEAKSFAIWLTERQGGGSTFRLPTAAEVKAHPAKTNQFTASLAFCRR